MSYAAIHTHNDGYLDESNIEVFDRLENAVRYLDQHNDPKPTVFRLVEIPETAFWEWGIRKAGTTDEPMIYTHEGAARSSCFDGREVVKQRKGTTVWLPGGAS